MDTQHQSDVEYFMPIPFYMGSVNNDLSLENVIAKCKNILVSEVTKISFI